MTTTETPTKVDLKAADVVAAIVAAIEDGSADPAGWRAPWHTAANMLRPTNAKTGAGYTGGNRIILALYGSALAADQPSVWATFNQWRDLGAAVNKGSKGTPIFRPRTVTIEDADTGDKAVRLIGWSVHYVFHASQVTGWTAPPVEERPPAATDYDAETDLWFDAIGRVIETRHTAEPRAYYAPLTDHVHLPDRDLFALADGYYSTRAHEYGHATGHASRLDRDLTKATRGGIKDYASEELVAELTAAITMANLGRSAEPRPDHAQYLASWLGALQANPRHLFTVAAAAERAAGWLAECAGKHLADARRSAGMLADREPALV